MEGCGPSLLGRDLLYSLKLNWATIMMTNLKSTIAVKLETALKNKEVFLEEF